MSYKVVQAVRALQMSPAECAVLVVFAEHANDDGTNSFPSAELVAWETNYCETQVRRIIARLREMRLLVPETGTQGGRGRVPVYRVCPENGNNKLPFSTADKVAKGNKLSQKEDKGSQVVGGLSQEKGNITDRKGSQVVTKKGNILSNSDAPPPPGPLSPFRGRGAYAPLPGTVKEEPSSPIGYTPQAACSGAEEGAGSSQKPAESKDPKDPQDAPSALAYFLAVGHKVNGRSPMLPNAGAAGMMAKRLEDTVGQAAYRAAVDLFFADDWYRANYGASWPKFHQHFETLHAKASPPTPSGNGRASPGAGTGTNGRGNGGAPPPRPARETASEINARVVEEAARRGFFEPKT